MTQTATQFTAKTFAAYVLAAWKPRYVTSLNGQALENRLRVMVWHIERWARTDIYGDQALPRGYDAAMCGLQHAVITGRINGETYCALKALTMRQLCALVHTLLAECGDTTERYPRFLMERFGG